MKNIEYVFNSKNFVSQERAKARKKELLALGYQVLSENSKKTTFIKK
jgi:hypothetical protein